MRTLPSPLSEVRELRNEDCVAMWRCEEASSPANLADDGPNSLDLSDKDTAPVAADLVDGASTGSRVLDGSADHFRLLDSDYISTFQGGWSFVGWVRPGSVSSKGYVFGYGGTGESGGANNICAGVGFAPSSNADAPPHHYRLDSPTDGTAQDVGSTGGNDLAASNAGKIASVSGQVDSAAEFNGDSDSEFTGSSVTYALGSNFTLGCWIQRGSTPGSDQYPLSLYADSNNYARLRILTTGVPVFDIKGGGTAFTVNGTTNACDGDPHYVVCMRRSGTWRIFVDGTEEANSTTSVTISGSTQLTIGGPSPGGTSHWDSWVDEASVWPSEGLSDADVSSNYTTTNGGTSLAPPASTGEVFVEWQHSTNTDVTSTTTGAGVEADKTYLVGVAVEDDPDNSGKKRARVYVWDHAGGTSFSETFSNLTATDSTTTAEFSVGRDPFGTSSLHFDGRVTDLQVGSAALTEEWFRDQFALGRRTWDVTTLYEEGSYHVSERILVEDGDGTMRDVTDLFTYEWDEEASWRDDVDSPGKTSTLSLRRDVYKFSMAPFMEASALNLNAAGTYDQLLAIGRKVKVETATVPYDFADTGVPEYAYDLQFEGTIAKVAWGEEPVRVVCRDRSGALLDNYITTGLLASNNPYGDAAGVAVETEMQQMLTDFEPSNVDASYGTYLGETGVPQIYTPTSPGWMIRQWNQENMSTHQALQRLADQIGWLLRYKWDDNRQEFRLTFYEPDRTNTTPDYTFGADEYRSIRNIEVALDDVRNFCDVYYFDASGAAPADNLDQYGRTKANDVDATSIGKYGFRPCEIAEAATSNIQTPTEASTLAAAVVDDLSEPKAVLEVETDYKPFVELGDLYRFSANGIHFSSSQDLAVVSYRHSLSASTAKTTITLRGKPAGRIGFARGAIASPGVAPTTGRDAIDTPAAPDIERAPGGAWVSWPQPVNNLSRQYDQTEVHASTTAGFTPSSSTLVATTRGNTARIRDLTRGSTYYFRLVHRDAMRNSSAAGTVSSGIVVPYAEVSTPRFRATRSTQGEAVGTSYGALTWDTEQYDPGGDFDGVDEFTAPTAGIYHFGAAALCRGGTATQLALYVDSGGGYAQAAQGASFPDTWASLATDLELGSGDKVKVYAKSTGSDFHTDGHFSGHLVGDS